MKTLLGLLSLLVLAAPAVLPPATPDPAPVPPAGPAQVALEGVAVSPDGVVSVGFGDSGVPLYDLLDGLSRALDRPVLYKPTEVGDTRLFGHGTETLPADGLLEAASLLLQQVDFLIFEEHAPLSALRVVHVGSNRSGPSRSEVPQRLLALEDLGRTPSPFGGVYSVVLPLEHLDARSAMASFVPWFDTSLGGIRNVENSNSLVLSSPSLPTLRHVVHLARLADQEALGGSENLHERVEALEQDLARLTEQLQALQGTGDR